jgi:WD40 repeat protein
MPVPAAAAAAVSAGAAGQPQPPAPQPANRPAAAPPDPLSQISQAGGETLADGRPGGRVNPASCELDRELYEFLAPPQGPGEVGRLGGYAILTKLDEGGMGVVFRAHDPNLARSVALKAMLPALATNAASRERFLHEARATAALRHDNVITIYQVSEDRGVPFLAMEFLQGETLQDCLRRERRLPVAEVLRIGREVAAGLAAAHRQGLLHRDIKPGNLWLEAETRRVKILDFGLARALGGDLHLTQTGAVVGTPLYMAPEQAQGEALDQRCDLFSLGCVLYQMCAGQLPFKGANPMAILRAVALENPTPPGQLNPEVPPALNDLILRLLAKDRAGRPASAAEVIREIVGIERGGSERTQPMAIPVAPPVAIPVQPAAPSPPTVTSVPGARGRARWGELLRRRPVWMAAAAVLALGGLLTLSLLRGDRKPKGADSPSPVAGANGGGGITVGPRPKADPRPVVLPEAPGPEFIHSFVGHTGPIQKVVYAQDGKSFYALSANELWLWDVDRPRQELQRLDLPTPVGGGNWTSLALSPDQTRALLGASNGWPQVVVWDLPGNKEIHRLTGHSTGISDLAFSPDQQQALSADSRYVTRLWDMATGKEVYRLEGDHACFSRDGRTILTAKANFMILWDAATGKEARQCEIPTGGPILCFVPFADGRRVLVGLSDSTVRVWDLDKGAEVQAFSGHAPGGIDAVALSPDERRVLSGGTDRTMRLWNVASGEELHCYKGHTNYVSSVTFSPGGRRALSGSGDQTIRLWSLPE